MSAVSEFRQKINFVTEKQIVRLKVGLYSGLIFFSFFTIIAVSVTTNKIQGCFLFGNSSTPGPSSNCNYAVAVAVIFQLLYGLFRLITLLGFLLMLGRFHSEFVLFTDLFQRIYTAVDILALLLVFLSACILSAGINSSCSDYCIKKDGSAESRMHIAEASAWISFILWLVMVVVGVFWLFRQGKLPFVSKPAQPAQDEDGTPGAATAPGPQMETPPGTSDEAKY